jgi:hypothetical protein
MGVAVMQTFVFAGDESGDVSFKFEKGASRYFVVTAIGTTEPQALRQALADVQQREGLPAHYEFSFNGLASGHLRRRVLPPSPKPTLRRGPSSPTRRLCRTCSG